MASRYDYSGITQTAHDLVYRFGSTVTVTRNYNPTLWTERYSPTTGQKYWVNKSTGESVTTPPTKTYSGEGVVTKYSIEELSASAGQIRVTDKKLVIYGIPEPAEDDVFTVNGTNYKYISHETVAPSGEVILYKIQIRI